jgi:hypothetical protein
MELQFPSLLLALHMLQPATIQWHRSIAIELARSLHYKLHQ